VPALVLRDRVGPANRRSPGGGAGEARFGGLAPRTDGSHDAPVAVVECDRSSSPPALGLDIRVRMDLRVGPAQLLLSELLPLGVAELGPRLDAELAANGALEQPTPLSCPGCGHPLWRDRCLRCVAGERAGPADRSARIPIRTSPREQVLREAAASLSAVGRRIAAHLVADVDEHGVLDEALTAIADRLGVGVDAVAEAVAALRAAGHPGLCARSVAESLLLQAGAGRRRLPPDVEALLSRGAPALAAGSTAAAALASGLSPERLREALGWLRAHVVPELFETGEPVSPPSVDVVVRRSGRALRAIVVPGPWSAVRVAESYRALADDPSVRRDVARADRFVTALGRREWALKRVTEQVVIRQSARVTTGRRAHRPLTRREIAGEVGVHESTVSRVVAGKSVALPSGETVPMAALFGAGCEIQHCLRDLVREEATPLSDAALAAALARRGHRVARRTVAKYRAELGIPDRRLR
jgi:RNA polymerase sigma-54 factor